nr:hypothetical protein [Tanacetum cinerariifolium]
ILETWAFPTLGPPAVAFKTKLKILNKNIKQWRVKVVQTETKALCDTRLKIDSIDNKTETSPLSSAEIDSRATLVKKLADLEHIKIKNLKQIAKIRWATEGDENTHFFHGIINNRSNRSRIYGLNIQGLSSLVIGSNDSPMMRYNLLIILSLLMKLKWLFGAPGPDGFKFFKKHWEIIENDVVAYVKEFESSSLIPRGCNSSFITLVPKVDDPLVAPRKTILELESIRRKFFWDRCADENKIAWVAWDKAIAPRNKGGLNIGSLKSCNLAMLAKWWWRFRIEPHALWCKVIKSYHGPSEGLHDNSNLKAKSELRLIQIARRVSDYRIRRIADRGNEEDGPDSRARGDRFYHNRRSADRGNEKVDRDPGNIFEIKGLRRRVRDLEIQHEIRHIQKRIRELELQREMRKETESRYVVRDDVNEEEEYPSFDSYPRSFEPIYPDIFSKDETRFDEEEVVNTDYEESPVFDDDPYEAETENIFAQQDIQAKVFWCTAIAYDPNPPVDETQSCPLKEYLIKFSVMNGKKTLNLDFNTFITSTSLYYNNGEFVAHPSLEAIKAKLAKMLTNPSYLDKTHVLKHSIPMIAYCLITRTKVDISEIIYSDLVIDLTSNVPDPQDPKRNIQLAGMGLPSTSLDEGNRKLQPLPEGTTANPNELGETLEGIKPPANMKPQTNPIADPSGTGAKYQVDETQSTRLRYRSLTKNKGKSSSEVKPNSKTLQLNTFVKIQALLLSNDDRVQESNDEELFATGKEIDEDISTTDEEVQVQESNDEELFATGEEIDEDISTTDEECEKHEEAVVYYAKLRASIEGYYEENVDNKDQINKLLQATMNSLNKNSTERADLLIALNGDTVILKVVHEAIKEDHNIIELLSLAKTFDFFSLKSLVETVKAALDDHNDYLAT